MEPEDLPLESLISVARYAKYRAAARGDHAKASRLYIWNARLSAAYWPAIAMVEVAIRNALNVQLCKKIGCTPEIGWHVDALSDRPRIHLYSRELDKLNKSLTSFDRKHDQLSGPRRIEPTGDDVVGGTSLGLWVALCGEGAPKVDFRYNYHRNLWRPALHKAFPGYEGPRIQDKPGPIRDALREFERLRNRIAHHEPIYMFKHAYQLSNLLRLASWLDDSLATFLRKNDQVTPVLQDYGKSVAKNEEAVAPQP